MEAEHRELGLGDPALGRRIRKLVSSLGRRVKLFPGMDDAGRWDVAVNDSIYQGEAESEALEHTAHALRTFRADLRSADVAALARGTLG
jgi:cytochrome b pre-mRNA-processing protein 3